LGLDYQKFVTTDPQYYRPAEIHDLVADSSKAKAKLGWKNNYQFIDLVKEMVESDLEFFKQGFK
jgi:GDPmannose 4,6-dehydratase